jgi:hypothetical protein
MENINDNKLSNETANQTNLAMKIAHWLIVLFCFVAPKIAKIFSFFKSYLK